MLILVSYDVPDDRRRTRLATALQDLGKRVQWSVFEAELTAEQVARLAVDRFLARHGGAAAPAAMRSRSVHVFARKMYPRL